MLARSQETPGLTISVRRAALTYQHGALGFDKFSHASNKAAQDGNGKRFDCRRWRGGIAA